MPGGLSFAIPIRMAWLFEPQDDQMRRYGTLSAPEWRDGQRCGIASGIADRDGCIDLRGLDEGHFNDLAGAGGASHDGVGEFVAIESQVELPGLVDADLKQDLIGADRLEVELRGANARDAGPCPDRPILREGHIGGDGDCGGIVAGHQGEEVRIVEESAGSTGGTFGTCWTGGTFRACWACWTGNSCGSFGTSRAGGASGSGGPSRAGWTLGARSLPLRQWNRWLQRGR